MATKENKIDKETIRYNLSEAKKSLTSEEAVKLLDKFEEATQKDTALDKMVKLRGDKLEEALMVWRRNRVKASSLEDSKVLKYDIDDLRAMTWKEFSQWLDDAKKKIEFLEENKFTLFNEERERRRRAFEEFEAANSDGNE